MKKKNPKILFSWAIGRIFVRTEKRIIHGKRAIRVRAIEVILYHYIIGDRKGIPKLSPFAFWPGAMINSHWLEKNQI